MTIILCQQDVCGITIEMKWMMIQNENANNNRINNDKTIRTKSFEYKAKIIGATPDNNNILGAEVVVPLNNFSNFWRSLGLPLINCEIELDLPWSKECIISEISITSAVPGNQNANPPVPDVSAVQTFPATF